MNDGKPVALVTGAGTGIGRSAVLALARSGYDLVVNFNRSEEAARATARDAEAAGDGAGVEYARWMLSEILEDDDHRDRLL